MTPLKCPFCGAELSDIDFKPHISQSHPDEGPQKGYIRWMENLRLDAGGKLYSGGSG